jgi:hypothetical protein
MERVTGIGGVFFRSSDPGGLSRWYAEHLGVYPPPESYDPEAVGAGSRPYGVRTVPRGL